MLMSDFINDVHWVIYFIEIASFFLLFSRFRMWAALWITGLFLTQAAFSGCIVVQTQNHFLLQEGLKPLPNVLLTDYFTSSTTLQTILSLLIAAVTMYLAWDHYCSLKEDIRART